MNATKRIIDILMTTLIVFLMSYQVTGEVAHEFIGVTMFILVIIHQVLNLKWYSALFKGKYNPRRIIMTIVNVLLLILFLLTAISGTAMSNHAVQFLYNIINVNTARTMHLAFSYWSFILMGLHIGFHLNMITAGMHSKYKKVFLIIFTIIVIYGLYLFFRSEIINYITFKTHFAFLDYEKNKLLVLFENISMLVFFSSIAYYITKLISNKEI